MSEVPDQYKQQWDEASEELAAASIELNNANRRYQAAIIARIAVSQLIRENKHE